MQQLVLTNITTHVPTVKILTVGTCGSRCTTIKGCKRVRVHDYKRVMVKG